MGVVFFGLFFLTGCVNQQKNQNSTQDDKANVYCQDASGNKTQEIPCKTDSDCLKAKISKYCEPNVYETTCSQIAKKEQPLNFICNQKYQRCEPVCLTGSNTRKEDVPAVANKNENIVSNAKNKCNADQSLIDMWKNTSDMEFKKWQDSLGNFCVCEFSSNVPEGNEGFFTILYECDNYDGCAGCEGGSEPSCEKSGAGWQCEIQDGEYQLFKNCYRKFYEAKKPGCGQWAECCVN